MLTRLRWTRRVNEERSASLQSVCVAPDRRGQGVGSTLLAAGARKARRQGCTYVAVHTSPRSVRLYERAGYRVSSGLRELGFDRELGEATGRTTEKAAR